MKIFFVGGGTGGSVTPLLAVAQSLKKLRPKTQFFFIGQNKEREQVFLQSAPIKPTHLVIPAGKWRRYFSLWNLLDLVKIFFGFLKSLYLIRRYRPDLIFGAGSYVQVPVVWAALLLRVPAVIHQPDFRVLLSTRLCAPLARAVTVAFRSTVKEFSTFSGLFKKIDQTKIFYTGNPVRPEIIIGSAETAREVFSLSKKFPTVLVVGGSTGSAQLNKIVRAALPELVKYVQVIHIFGSLLRRGQSFVHPHYHPYQFLGSDLAHAYAAADLVISRGGLSTITELASLGKAAILVPLPHSPQETNVHLLAYTQSAVGVSQDALTPDLLVKLVRKILWSKELQETMQQNIKKIMPRDAGERIAKLMLKIYDQQK